jgi:uncharacterized protein with beta-barrel porin domain
MAALLATPVLVALTAFVPSAARAQTAGGNGGTGSSLAANTPGGAGGTGDTGAPGNSAPNATRDTNDGGGGGGGGAAGGGTGGNGGSAIDPGAGGSGGAAGAAGINGGAGNPGASSGTLAGGGGGGGGGGGLHGFNGAALPGATLTGDNGGAGGNGGDGLPGGGGGGGGGGGAGGYGAVVTAATVNVNTSTITGGNGGVGGNAGASPRNPNDFNSTYVGGGGGAGGDGGVGIHFTASGASLNNAGTIQGGKGGAGGAAGVGDPSGSAGNPGAGGAGIVGGGLTIINSGTIAGGLAGNGVTRANAITFNSGINSLTLQAGSSIVGNVVAFSTADTLALGGTANASFNVAQIGAQYLGFGNFSKTGTSTWTLTGTNAAVLPWIISAGALSVDGTMANSTMTVNAGGTLDGTGSVGATTINNGATFMPGNGTPGSSITVAGNLAFASGALYLVQINPATASLANVTGTAYLGGATVSAIFAAGSYVSKQYTIVQATGAVSGTFNPTVVTTNLPSDFHTTLSYDTHDAYLNLTLNFGIPGGLNGNQQNVGNALTNFFNTTGGIPLVFGALTPAGLSQASGETATGSQQTTFDAMNLFMGVMTDPFSGGRGDIGPSAPMGYASTQTTGVSRDAYAMFTKAPPAAFEQRWSVWTAGYGGSQTTDGNAAVGSNTATSSVYGTVIGADYRISPFTIAGLALAGGGTNFSVAGSGSGHSDLFQAGAFVRHTVGPAYILAALAYGWQDITTNRTVTVAGVDQLQAKFNANAFSGRLEGGYRFATPWMGVTPYAAAQFTTFDLPAYAESALSGASTFALAYNAKDVTDTRSELGIRTDRSFALTDAILTLRGRLAWEHDYNPDRSIAATFETLPGASFVVNGAAQAADAALTTVSAELKWINGWSAAATFEGEFSDVTRSYAGKGVVRYAW